MREIDRQYLATPFYGSRRMKVWLERQGILVSRKRVQRQMRVMGLRAIYRRPCPTGAGSAGLSLSVGEGRNHQTQPGLGRRYHLLAHGPGIPLPGGRHGLAQPYGPVRRLSNTWRCAEALTEALDRGTGGVQH